MIAVFANEATPRLHYVCEVLLRRGLAHDVAILTDRAEFDAFEGIKFNYSKLQVTADVHIWPIGLIEKNGIEAITPEAGTWEELPTLFPTTGDVPFDLFSAAFYLLSRYEEYGPDGRDHLGRFQGSASLAHSRGFLELPIIDLWVKKLYTKLRANYVRVTNWRHSYQCEATLDVDSAFAYRHKGFIRTAGGFAKDMIAGKWKNARDRFFCLNGRMDDPYDTYAWLNAQHNEAGVSVRWFFLLADFGKYDTGLPWRSRALQALIRRLRAQDRVGIHPGVAAFHEPMTLAEEVRRLGAITGDAVRMSRQHYLMLEFPKTYQHLLALEITEDHTMGYADQPGFRAGTSRPFPFYDLENERMTMLMVYPFAVMDATLNRYLKLSPDEAIEQLQKLAAGVKQADGQLRLLWHNETVSETAEWKGWRRVYTAALRL